MRSPRRALVGLLLVLAAGNLWVLFLRSGIPYELRGTVTDIEVGTEKLQGIDDVWIVHLDGRELHLDYDVARALGRQHVVDKREWSTTLHVEGRPDVSLHPSRDLWGMLPAMGVVIAVAIWRRRPAG